MNARCRCQAASSRAIAASYDAEGVDRSLIRWMLRLTPRQRLEYVQGVMDLACSARPSSSLLAASRRKPSARSAGGNWVPSIETMGGGCLQLALTSKAPVALDERRLQLKE